MSLTRRSLLSVFGAGGIGALAGKKYKYGPWQHGVNSIPDSDAETGLELEFNNDQGRATGFFKNTGDTTKIVSYEFLLEIDKSHRYSEQLFPRWYVKPDQYIAPQLHWPISEWLPTGTHTVHLLFVAAEPDSSGQNRESGTLQARQLSRDFTVERSSPVTVSDFEAGSKAILDRFSVTSTTSLTSAMLYVNPTIYGFMEAFKGNSVAFSRGAGHGFAYAIEEVIGEFQDIIEDPVEYGFEIAKGFIHLLKNLEDNPTIANRYLEELGAEMKQDNPYSNILRWDLHTAFNYGWAGGYLVFQLLLAKAGAAATRTIKQMVKSRTTFETQFKELKESDNLDRYRDVTEYLSRYPSSARQYLRDLPDELLKQVESAREWFEEQPYIGEPKFSRGGDIGELIATRDFVTGASTRVLFSKDKFWALTPDSFSSTQELLDTEFVLYNIKPISPNVNNRQIDLLVLRVGRVSQNGPVPESITVTRVIDVKSGDVGIDDVDDLNSFIGAYQREPLKMSTSDGDRSLPTSAFSESQGELWGPRNVEYSGELPDRVEYDSRLSLTREQFRKIEAAYNRAEIIELEDG